MITCAWQPAGRYQEDSQAPDLAAWLVSSALQQWARQVPGSFWGQTPVHAQAQETAQALRHFLDAAVQALGWGAGEGGLVFRVIGPLVPGSAGQVGRQLAQLGWPIS